MSVARNIIKNPKLLPGGGATELTVCATLKQKSSSIEGIEKVSGRLVLFGHYHVQV
jgi:T-complex protein 1 subunit gamma